ncbi:MAG: hypothetical protein ERJ67_04700 [Aphanocapsa feldmannii 277cV]|uniref:Uncharacterized protein n=1 Tax=Aphanocapsa feldmannii 277cV TaxID=2507553 RepID=A0A524RNY6_9CHRO|nr:MAG: hypothetical protein ERJ69_07140 [Aphanocapsa feldmannii 288cV]TGG93061.1 MAG: hypothetical protein ERJ67_04700 [Aphanocapsa feldmannii 277cV]
MNASDQVRSLEMARLLANLSTAFRQRFPVAKPSLNPWRDDPHTKAFAEEASLDLAFHFPGWSPRNACRSVLVELRLLEPLPAEPRLMGVVLRGMTYQGEQWKLTSLGDWPVTGASPPSPEVVRRLQDFVRDAFALLGAAPDQLADR